MSIKTATNIEESLSNTEHLKKETAHLHTLTEKAMQSHRLLAPTFTIKEYCSVLLALNQAHTQIHELLDQLHFEMVEQKHHQQIKVQWIKSDLAKLGVSNSTSNNLRLPEPYPANKSQTTAFSLGLMYVSEGSAMGGQYILKKLQVNEAIASSKALRFYEGDQENGLQYWITFKAELDDLPEEQLPWLVQGAKFAFHLFIDAAQQHIPS